MTIAVNNRRHHHRRLSHFTFDFVFYFISFVFFLYKVSVLCASYRARIPLHIVTLLFILFFFYPKASDTTTTTGQTSKQLNNANVLQLWLHCCETSIWFFFSIFFFCSFESLFTMFNSCSMRKQSTGKKNNFFFVFVVTLASLTMNVAAICADHCFG